MEIILAQKLEELELMQLEDLLRNFRMEDRDAFEVLKELIEDL